MWTDFHCEEGRNVQVAPAAWATLLCLSSNTCHVPIYAVNAAQTIWSVFFAQERLIASAALLCGIALSLGVAVASLASFKAEAESLYWSIPFWTVHFPIGLHGGWTLAGKFMWT